jgi:hypothetical protein
LGCNRCAGSGSNAKTVSQQMEQYLGSQHRPVTGRKWSTDEDINLKDAVQRHGGKNWGAIAALVPCRARSQCHSRWSSVGDPKFYRLNKPTGINGNNRWNNILDLKIVQATGSKWSADEDSKLKDSIQTHGGKNWRPILRVHALNRSPGTVSIVYDKIAYTVKQSPKNPRNEGLYSI